MSIKGRQNKSGDKDRKLGEVRDNGEKSFFQGERTSEDMETGETTSTSKKKDLHHPDLKKNAGWVRIQNDENIKDKRNTLDRGQKLVD